MESPLRTAIAHMLRGAGAVGLKMVCPAPATLVHVCPWRCQVPRPAQCPVPPKTQTSVGLNAVMPVGWNPGGPPSREKDLAIVHLPVCQCSTFPTVTAQASRGPSALTATTEPTARDGIALADHLP